MSAHFFCLAGRKAADIGALRSECPLFSCFCGWMSGGSVIFGGTCGAPRVIAPWRGEREWVPVSNRLYARSLTCARTDGRCVSSGGGDVHTRCPLARPFGGSPPTLAGALPPECIFGSRRTFSLYGCFSALRLHVSHVRPGCIVLYCFHGCVFIVCIHSEVQRTCEANSSFPRSCSRPRSRA